METIPTTSLSCTTTPTSCTPIRAAVCKLWMVVCADSPGRCRGKSAAKARISRSSEALVCASVSSVQMVMVSCLLSCRFVIRLWRNIVSIDAAIGRCFAGVLCPVNFQVEVACCNFPYHRHCHDRSFAAVIDQRHDRDFRRLVLFGRVTDKPAV